MELHHIHSPDGLNNTLSVKLCLIFSVYLFIWLHWILVVAWVLSSCGMLA